ncbi:MAG: dihydroorotase [Deltaproteobacteria bacterium]|jgi:dihydroorotase|nr:dihydroorotase [Deltaproteobacteria bacterium]
MLTKIQGGRVIDPGRLDKVADIIVEDDHILEIIAPGQTVTPKTKLLATEASSQTIDAAGKIVCPGLIDMHVHLREPGHEHKETIESGARAAAWGGFTAVCSMPNTDPVNDNCDVTEFILSKSARANGARVFPAGAISMGLAGRKRSDFEQLKACGVVAVSDDGNPVMDDRLMRDALTVAASLELAVISHCEDMNLAAGGVMNAGPVAAELNLAGIPNASESEMVKRDIALSKATGAPVHIAHVSTAESVAALRRAKSEGLAVTAETAPHYFLLTDTAVRKWGTHAKMNPPLRSESDRAAIRQGLADGTIDVIATDHAPHSDREKAVAFDAAANGVIGLETAVSLSLKLVQEGVISITDMIAKMSTHPARILGLACGLQPGGTADITIIDPQVVYQVDANRFQSLSRNCPFDGWRLTGRPVLTMVGGRVVYQG